MPSLNRHGFTLIEMLVVVTVLVVIVGVAVESITTTQRSSSMLLQRVGVQQNTRAAAYYLTHVLRELDAGEGDIAVAQATTLEVRGMP